MCNLNYRVSIIVPVYNTAEYLEKCVDSILYQNYPFIEIVLVNDGSTDNSKEIINDYARRNPSIVKAIHIENSGVSLARNLGIQASSGDLIGFVDSDDYISSTYIENLVAPFYECQELCMSLANVTYVYTENGNKNYEERASVFDRPCFARDLLNELHIYDGGGTLGINYLNVNLS